MIVLQQEQLRDGGRASQGKLPGTSTAIAQFSLQMINKKMFDLKKRRLTFLFIYLFFASMTNSQYYNGDDNKSGRTQQATQGIGTTPTTTNCAPNYTIENCLKVTKYIKYKKKHKSSTIIYSYVSKREIMIWHTFSKMAALCHIPRHFT